MHAVDAQDRWALGRIGVDFDGVLADRDTGRPLPGAKAALRSLAKRWSVVIYTQRPAEARAWLRRHRLSGLVETVTDGKPSVWLYIDDRGLRFEGDWAQTLADVERLAPAPPPEPEPVFTPIDSVIMGYDPWVLP